MRRYLAFAAKALVTVLLFTILFRPQMLFLPADLFGGVTPLLMYEELMGANPARLGPWLLLGSVVRMCGLAAGTLRWRVMLRAQGIGLPYRRLLGTWFVGRFLGLLLPSTLGLDGYRLYDSARQTGEVARPTAVIATEKITGFAVLAFMICITAPLGIGMFPDHLGAVLTLWALAVLVLAASLLLLFDPSLVHWVLIRIPVPELLRRPLDTMGAAVATYKGHRGALAVAALLTFSMHLATCFVYFCTMMGVRAANISLLDILFATPVMIVGVMAGPSIGGEGIREMAFVLLLGDQAGPVTAALFAHLGWWAGDVAPFMVGAVVFWVRRGAGKDAAPVLPPENGVPRPGAVTPQRPRD